MFATIIHSTYFHGALVGLCGAVGPDIHTFLKAKDYKDFDGWNWRTALLHYAQGVLGGLIATPVLSGLFGI